MAARRVLHSETSVRSRLPRPAAPRARRGEQLLRHRRIEVEEGTKILRPDAGEQPVRMDAALDVVFRHDEEFQIRAGPFAFVPDPLAEIIQK